MPSDAHPFGVGQPERTPALSVLPAVLTALGGLSLAVLSATFGSGGSSALLFAGVAVVIAGAGRTVTWLFRRYEVLDDRLVVHEGVIEQSQRVVPYRRIQQVDLRESAVQRILGLATVHVGTAGGSEAAEVAIDALQRPRAEALRDFLLGARDQAQEQGNAQLISDPGALPVTARATSATADHTPFLTLSWNRLALAGATGSSIWLGAGAVAALIFAVLQLAGDAESQTVETVERLAGWSILALLMLAVGVFLVLPALGAAYAMVQFGGYQLWLTDDAVRVSHGLLARRRLTMPRHRVHVVVVSDNPVRRILGVRSVVVRSASRGDSEEGADSGTLTIPLLRDEECDRLLYALLATRLPALVLRPPAARRRSVRRRVLCVGSIGLAATALTVALDGPVPPALALIATVVLTSLSIVWGRAAYRRGGHSLDQPTVWLGHGLFTHRLVAVRRSVVQSAATTAGFFQRRSHLTTLRVDVAARGGAPVLLDMSAETGATIRAVLAEGPSGAEALPSPST